MGEVGLERSRVFRDWGLLLREVSDDACDLEEEKKCSTSADPPNFSSA